jgi:hypothetical protein
MNSVNNIVNIIYEHMQKTYIIKNWMVPGYFE